MHNVARIRQYERNLGLKARSWGMTETAVAVKCFAVLTFIGYHLGECADFYMCFMDAGVFT